MRTTGFLFASFAGLGLLTGNAFGAPEDPGPYTTAVHDAGSLSIAGVQIPTKVYYPTNAPVPGPLLVVMHGNLRTGSYHVVLANTLASHGFVLVLPNMPCGLNGCNHDENATQLSGLLDWATTENQSAPSPLFGKMNEKRGLLGHSYGGLGVFLATARDPSVDAVVLFDPKDDLGAAEDEQANIQVPSAHLMAEVRGLCNDDWATAIYPNTTSPHLRLRVSGAGHCDVEDPSDQLCPLACGSGAGGAHLFRRYAVAFMGCVLAADQSMAPYLAGTAMADDVANGAIDLVDHSGLETLPCLSSTTAPPLGDGGVNQNDAAATDMGTAAEDAGASTPEAGGVSPDADANAPDTGSASADASDPVGSFRPTRDAGVQASEVDDGCRCVTSAETGQWTWLLAGFGLLALRARRSKRIA